MEESTFELVVDMVARLKREVNKLAKENERLSRRNQILERRLAIKRPDPELIKLLEEEAEIARSNKGFPPPVGKIRFRIPLPYCYCEWCKPGGA